LVLGRRPLGAVLHSSNEPGELSLWLYHDDSTINIVLEFQCYAWTEYKFTCVYVSVSLCACVSVTLSVNSPTGRTPQRIFTVDSLKDADLRKDVPCGGLDDE